MATYGLLEVKKVSCKTLIALPLTFSDGYASAGKMITGLFSILATQVGDHTHA